MENHTAKNFALQLGSLASLYLSLTFLLILIFGVINLLYPDIAEGYWAIESASSSIRTGLAMVLVFYPTYLILTRLVNQNRRTEKEGMYLTLTKWLIYLSLLVGGGVLLGDLVAIIMAFLEGELTTRFLLKALAVVLIVGSAFYYYIQDARGYWIKNEKQSIYFASGATLIVLTAIIFGFSNIQTPAEVREKRIDERQITDLQDLQYRVVNYYEMNSTFPESLETLPKTSPLPQAPESRTNYEYQVTEDGFTLCATFAYASNPNQYRNYAYPLAKEGTIINFDDWSHGDGNVCFLRVINK